MRSKPTVFQVAFRDMQRDGLVPSRYMGLMRLWWRGPENKKRFPTKSIVRDLRKSQKSV